MQTVWAIALGAAVFRFLLFRGLDLYADEAYYWMWSRRLATGYFDHPPMVAWLIRAGTRAPPRRAGRAHPLPRLRRAGGGLRRRSSPASMSDDPRVPGGGRAPRRHLPHPHAHRRPGPARRAGGGGLRRRPPGSWRARGGAAGSRRASRSGSRSSPSTPPRCSRRRSSSSCSSTGDLRRELRTPWPWLGGAVAVLIFLPNLALERLATAGWPSSSRGGTAWGARRPFAPSSSSWAACSAARGSWRCRSALWRILRGRDSFTDPGGGGHPGAGRGHRVLGDARAGGGQLGRARLPGALRRRRRPSSSGCARPGRRGCSPSRWGWE